MKLIREKPYKVIGKIQNYEWGTKNKNAFIPQFLEIVPEPDIPYAEYWIGIHPKAPSDLIVDDKSISLAELLDKHAVEILGERIATEFNNTLPFLLKILSIDKALSIQAHPNKKLAAVLHKNDPVNYPDSNHKPEIAIAIDNLQAIIGLKSIIEIRDVLENFNEIEKLLHDDLLKTIKSEKYDNHENIVKELYSQIMNSSGDKLEECIISIHNKLKGKTELNQSENQFMIEYNNYGIDVGLISILLYNFIDLKKEEAIFTPAGLPHAYLKGNIIECMANSDNVVRAGLTPKFKDVKTLTKMLNVDSSEAIVELVDEKKRVVYKTPAKEFQIERLKLENEINFTANNEINFFLVLSGEISIRWESSKSELFTKGEIVLIPAILKNYTILQQKPSEVYRITVPN